MKSISISVLSLLVSLVSGCSDSTSTDNTGAQSKVEYTYSGNVSGTFKVEGAYPSQKEGSGASSTLSADRKTITISAIDWTKSGSEANFIDFIITSNTAIADNQVFSVTDANSNVAVASGYGIDHTNINPADVYVAISGSATLTTVKDNQIKGTFGFVVKNGAGNTVTIANGKLDVKY